MQASLVRAAVASDAPTVLALSRRCDRFAQVTFVEPMEGYIQRMLWALAADGIIPDDACHDPLGPPLAPAERERVAHVMRTLESYS